MCVFMISLYPIHHDWSVCGIYLLGIQQRCSIVLLACSHIDTALLNVLFIIYVEFFYLDYVRTTIVFVNSKYVLDRYRLSRTIALIYP